MRQPLESVLAEAEGYIRRDVATGFEDLAPIARNTAEVFAEDYPEQNLIPHLEAIVTRVVAEQLQSQSAWPAVTDCDRLDRAFEALEAAGIVARQHFSCCGNCGSGEIWDEVERVAATGLTVRGYTFFHMQDTWSAIDGCGLYLSYGSTEEGGLVHGIPFHPLCDVGWFLVWTQPLPWQQLAGWHHQRPRLGFTNEASLHGMGYRVPDRVPDPARPGPRYLVSSLRVRGCRPRALSWPRQPSTASRIDTDVPTSLHS